MKNIITIVLVSLSLGVLAQVEEEEIEMVVEVVMEEEEEKEAPVMFAEQGAEPVGGFEEYYARINKYVAENYTGEKGRVFVSFIVEKDGSLTDVKIFLKGLSETFDKVALNAIKYGGKWKPARQGGRSVRIEKRIPINY